MTIIYLDSRALGRTDLMRAKNTDLHVWHRIWLRIRAAVRWLVGDDPYTAPWLDIAIALTAVAFVVAAVFR